MTKTYLKETLRQFLGDSSPEEFPPHLAALLLRTEEYQINSKDQWGNWEHSFADNFRRGKLLTPEIDLWVAAQNPKARWPNGCSFAVCLTHDVDHISAEVTFSQRFRALRRAYQLGEKTNTLKNLAKLFVKKSVSVPDTAQTVQRCVEIEHGHGVSASYFFTVYPVEPISRYDCLYTFDDPCRFRGNATTV